MKMHENVFRRCPSLCRRTPHRFCRVPCFPCSFYLFDFSLGSSSFVFFGIFREVFLQVVFHLGFQRCKGLQILSNLVGTFGFLFFSLQGLPEGSRPRTDPKIPFPYWKIDHLRNACPPIFCFNRRIRQNQRKSARDG